MKHKIELQLVTLDFWLNRLMMEKYGIRISARIVCDKIYIMWWKGTCTKGTWIKVGEAKLNIELTMPSKKLINKNIQKAMKGK